MTPTLLGHAIKLQITYILSKHIWNYVNPIRECIFISIITYSINRVEEETDMSEEMYTVILQAVKKHNSLEVVNITNL